ncbi:1-deoxy-D-xylulose 5-phosphate reductoisomerase [Candidatus Profftia lariciata]|uniref:1-deoxy-D-xylulose-5-phosphate reductoisomerase n=1 Tax=Candidatus Profftia lariciata TaxID=1987921 RepID=UPI001D023637|nr:1-deoxy-D-xylulose-5-phosphate reductoisomerase [Candidatus Profftia lariciata]UDG81553.1 1-deoxy-D-xylulose 5-phosphate reductoisomerase [Candidatus Profftia lariciata]
MKQLTILGSTGSIGINTLDVVRTNSNNFKIAALVAGKNVDMLVQQCIEFSPRYASVNDKKTAKILQRRLNDEGIFHIKVNYGEQSACELASLDDVDQVMVAIVGAAGLMPTMAAIKSNKRVLLANKESLVTCGRIFMDALKYSKAQLIPIDSEHSAIFRSLPPSIQHNLGFSSLNVNGVASIVLTGSGGPFRNLPINDFIKITVEQACNHPHWSMGKKISVDSATMMNKGLEYIEAQWLFNASEDEIEVVIHPQSIIHSIVRYYDGSMIAQLSHPDMRIPITYAMTYPNILKTNIKPIDFYTIDSLTFEQPDIKRYPCLQLAIDASRAGQAATTMLNAANEISVNAFLRGDIRFIDIAAVNQEVLLRLSFCEPNTVIEVIDIDRQTRVIANKLCTKFYI